MASFRINNAEKEIKSIISLNYTTLKIDTVESYLKQGFLNEENIGEFRFIYTMFFEKIENEQTYPLENQLVYSDHTLNNLIVNISGITQNYIPFYIMNDGKFKIIE